MTPVHTKPAADSVKANLKLALIVIIGVGACLLSITLSRHFGELSRNNQKIQSQVESTVTHTEHIRLLGHAFATSADPEIWTHVTGAITSIHENMEEASHLSRRWEANIQGFTESLDEYEGVFARMYAPAEKLQVEKELVQQIGLRFSDEIKQGIIDPFKDEESVRFFKGEPIDPLKSRAKHTAFDLLVLHANQQILLLELLLDMDLESYERDRQQFADKIEQHKAQLRYIAILMGSDPVIDKTLKSIEQKLDELLAHESVIVEQFRILSQLNVELGIAGDQLFADSEALSDTVATDMVRVQRLNRNVNSALLLAILVGFGILGLLLSRNISQFVSDLKLAQNKVLESEENLLITLNSIGDAVVATDVDCKITNMNPVAERLTGWSLTDARGRLLSDVLKLIDVDNRSPIDSPADVILTEKKAVELPPNAVLVSRAGDEIAIADSGAPLLNEQGDLLGVVLTFRDISEKQQLEERLRHSQKMDAIGQLAGGVAHDFNNMLGGIMGAAELLAFEADKDEKTQSYVDLIMDASSRAAELTQKLLSFSRKGRIQTRPVNIHECIDDALAILKRSIDKSIEIKTEFKADTTAVVGDATQLQNAVLNIGINARDAMPDGGILTIGTENLDLDEEYCERSAFDLVPGQYLQIMISDTGIGMDRRTQSRIFEPFYTTKSPDKGTGLGLASVYGSVVDHHGAIHVYSEPGQGTVFRMLIPISGVSQTKSEPPIQELIEKTGTVLVVDDESIVRTTTESLLKSMGMSVLVASDGVEALEIFDKQHQHIDVIILDVVMPRLSGRETFEKLKEIDSNVKVIIASGFAADTNIANLINAGASGFVQKPFRRHALAAALSSVL